MHGCDITLRQVEIVIIRRENVWYEQAVVYDRDRLLKSRDPQLFFALISRGLDVLPEAMKRVQKFPQGSDGGAADTPSFVQEVHQEAGYGKARNKLGKIHSVPPEFE